MRTTTHTTPAQTATRTLSPERDALQERFGTGRGLPRELREESAGMSWQLFTATYCPLPRIRVTPTGTRPRDIFSSLYTAEITELSKTAPARTTVREIAASGPASAFTHLLADEGRHVEMLKFHQIELYEATVTAIKVSHQSNHNRTAWAVGFGPTSEASIAAALSAAAQRIYG